MFKFNGTAFGQMEGSAFFVEVPQQDIEVADRPQRAPQPGQFGSNIRDPVGG